jgi:hypothetical protein
MKRLGFSVVLLSLALSAPASGQWASDHEYKYFYEGCGLYSCNSVAISPVQFGLSPEGFESWWAWGVFSFYVTGTHPELPPGTWLGGFQGGYHSPETGHMRSLSDDHAILSTWASETTVLELNQQWKPGSFFVIDMLYGPIGDEEWYDAFDDELAHEFVRVDLVMVAVPTPATWLLLASGLGGVAAVARRRRPT